MADRQSAAAASARSLSIGTRTLDINGRAATVYGLTGDNGQRGLTFRPGERFLVDVHNRLTEETLVHWHGLTPPVDQDGAPLSGSMLAPGEIRPYDFAIERPGTYWMHAHTLQEQNLLAAPLIVHSKQDETADLHDVVILLHDFSFTPASELFDALTHGAGHAMGHGDMKTMDMGQMSMDQDAMGESMAMDLNDIEYDAYLANDRTLDDPEVIRVEKSGRVRLRIINGAASTAFSISTGALTAQLAAVDGQDVEPVAGALFAITMGQRIDLIVTLPASGGAFPILALREGTPHRTGVILATAGASVSKIAPMAQSAGPVVNLVLESQLQSRSPLTVRKPDKRFLVHLAGDMVSYQWRMGGADAIAAKPGERVEIDIMNMSMMAHPMHLHGHHFQVVAIDGNRQNGAVRDTVLVPSMKTVTIAFDAGRPGAWAFHCHHLYHMESGMMSYVKIG